MNERDFTYWLQGFCEMTQSEPTKEQWAMIKEHLAQVFDKKTPLLGYETNKGTESYPVQPPLEDPFNQKRIVC